MKIPRKRALQWIGTLLSLGLFGLLVARQDWVSAWEYVRRVPLWAPVLALGFYLLSNLGNAWRWYMVLRLGDIPLPYWTAAKIVFLGAFASNFLPSTVGGDTARYFSLLRFTDKKGVGLVSLVVDRLLKMASMLSIAPLAAVFFAPLLREILSGRPAAGAALLPAGARRRLKQGWDVLTLWFQRPGDFARAFGVAWLSIFPAFLGMWLMARGLQIRVELYHVMGASTVTYFLTLLPVSVNGYGVREVLIAALYTYLGAGVEQSVALAVVTRLLMLAATLPGALWLPEVLAFSRREDKV